MSSNQDRFSMALTCKNLNSILLGDEGHECWGPGREALVSKLLKKSLMGQVLDQDFEEMHRLFRFTPDDVARLRVLSVAVSKNDLAMVQRVRALWPEMSGEMVVSYENFFFQQAFKRSGREVLAELRNWWGVEQIKAILSREHRAVSMSLLSKPYNNASGVFDLLAVVDFMRQMEVPIRTVLANNSNLLAVLLDIGGAGNGTSVVRMLSQWGMTLAELRAFNERSLWTALSADANALQELATWGLTKADASYDNYLVLHLAAERGQVDVLRVLSRTYSLNAESARMNDNAALRAAAKNGHVGALMILIDIYELETSDATAIDNEALRTAAKAGHVGVLQILRTKYGLSKQDAQARDNEALRGAAARGHINVLRELRDNYKLTREDARMLENEALREAAKAGHVEVLKLLKTCFGLVPKDARDSKKELLVTAAAGGHAAVLEVLSTHFELTTEDARVENNQPLRIAADHGRDNVLIALKTIYKLEPKDAQENGNIALISAASRGFTPVLKVLCEYYELTIKDAQTNKSLALRKAATHGHAEALHVLAKDFKLTGKDARENKNEALRQAAHNGHAEVLRVLARDFGLNAKDARENNIEALKGANSHVLKVLALEPFNLSASDARPKVVDVLKDALIMGDADNLKVLHEEYGLGRNDVIPYLFLFFFFSNLTIPDVSAAEVLACLREDYGLCLADLDEHLFNRMNYEEKLSYWSQYLNSLIKGSHVEVPWTLQELVEGWGWGLGDDATGRTMIKHVVKMLGYNVISSETRKYLDDKLGKGWDK